MSLVRALAAAGIGVVDDADPEGPRDAPVAGSELWTLSRWQVHTMSAEVTARSGISGADLNAAFPTPGALPISAILAGWMKWSGDEPARAAAALMGKSDWYQHDRLMYPMAVVQLFLADVARHVAAGSAGLRDDRQPAGGRQEVLSGGRSGPDLHCGNISRIVDDQLRALFELLKLPPQAIAAYLAGNVPVIGEMLGAIAAFLVSFWNSVLDVARKQLQEVVDQITAPAVAVVRLALGGMAMLSSVVSYLRPQSMPVDAKPAHLVLGPTPQTGELLARVPRDAVTAEWPDIFKVCAREYGIDLPTLAKPGDKVRWTAPTGDQSLTLGTDTTALDAAVRSTNHYTTATDDSPAKDTEIVYSVTWFAARAERSGVNDLLTMARKFVEAQLPQILADVVDPLLKRAQGELAALVAKVIGVDGRAMVAVGHRVAKPGKGCEKVVGVPAGRYSATFPFRITINGAVYHQSTVLFSLDATHTGTGRLTLTSNGRTVNGKLSLAVDADVEAGLPQAGGAILTGAQGGAKFDFRISGPVGTPIVSGTVTGGTPGRTSTWPVSLGLHLKHVDCSGVSGDVVALYREMYAKYLPNGGDVRIPLKFGGSGEWTATRR